MFNTADYRGLAALTRRTKIIVTFAILWLPYQSVEGIGEHWLHSFPVQAALMLAGVLMA